VVATVFNDAKLTLERASRHIFEYDHETGPRGRLFANNGDWQYSALCLAISIPPA
jgi:hypothetical protein